MSTVVKLCSWCLLTVAIQYAFWFVALIIQGKPVVGVPEAIFMSNRFLFIPTVISGLIAFPFVRVFSERIPELYETFASNKK